MQLFFFVLDIQSSRRRGFLSLHNKNNSPAVQARDPPYPPSRLRHWNRKAAEGPRTAREYSRHVLRICPCCHMGANGPLLWIVD